MHLETVRQRLEQQVSLPETDRRFLEARSRRPALAVFRRAGEVVAFLNETAPCARAARSEVTSALIAEVQDRRAPCWSAMLLVAYFPGLLRIRKVVTRTGTLTLGELDWLLIECFLQRAETFPLATQSKLAVVNLVLGTRKLVMEQLRQEARATGSGIPLTPSLEEMLPSGAPSAEELLIQQQSDQLQDPDRVWELVHEVCRDEPEDDLLLLLGTYASGTPLITYLHQRHPDADHRELTLRYEQCRKRRSRLVHKLRSKIRPSRLSQTGRWPALLRGGARS